MYEMLRRDRHARAEAEALRVRLAFTANGIGWDKTENADPVVHRLFKQILSYETSTLEYAIALVEARANKKFVKDKYATMVENFDKL
jgi:hypothetical protein